MTTTQQTTTREITFSYVHPQTKMVLGIQKFPVGTPVHVTRSRVGGLVKVRVIGTLYSQTVSAFDVTAKEV